MERIDLPGKDGACCPGYFGSGILSELPGLLPEISGNWVVVSDEVVADLYYPRLRQAFGAEEKDLPLLTVPAGEGSKNIMQWLGLVQGFARLQMDRGWGVLALGGGMVSDLAGFAAGCWLRGIPWVVCPTTLLSAVDAAIGGKTAVDLPQGKNLLGLFNPPAALICDTDVFDTLPLSPLREGGAEAIKTAVLFDSRLFAALEKGCDRVHLGNIVKACMQAKTAAVLADPLEQSSRRLLNLGHTPAHAIEKLSSYRISHGQAVGIGLGIIARASAARGYCSPETARRICSALEAWNLPLHCEYTASQLAQEAYNDKKRRADRITLALPRDIGDCFLQELPISQLTEFYTPALQCQP